VKTYRNVIRRNLIVGNPPVQVSVDNPSTSGVDIKNQAAEGLNTFQRNICLTSVNAPCPALGRLDEDSSSEEESTPPQQ
jgi:hypothetical protein